MCHKSDRIIAETCYVFHCAAESSSDIFGTAVLIALYWSIAPELSRQYFVVRKIETAVTKISDNDAAPQLNTARLYVNTMIVTYDTTAQWHYDTIRITGNQLFTKRSDFPDSNL